MSDALATLWRSLVEGRATDADVAPWLAGLAAVAAAAMALEIMLLMAVRRRGGDAGARDLLPTVLAGLCLMLALTAALAGAPAGGLLLLLGGAGIAHAVDLWQRWPRA